MATKVNITLNKNGVKSQQTMGKDKLVINKVI
jgi:azurin